MPGRLGILTRIMSAFTQATTGPSIRNVTKPALHATQTIPGIANKTINRPIFEHFYVAPDKSKLPSVTSASKLPRPSAPIAHSSVKRGSIRERLDAKPSTLKRLLSSTSRLPIEPDARLVKTIVIVGGGNIVRPILERLRAENYPMDKVIVSTRGSKTATNLAQKYGVVAMSNNREAVAKAVQDKGVILFALKAPLTLPAMQEVADVLQSVEPEQRPLVMSVSSTKLGPMEQVLGQETSIVRAMPNTPSQVGAGVTALFPSTQVNPEQRVFASHFFEKLGYVPWMDREEQMDTMTVHTGCGPATVFRFMEEMIAGGVRRGVPTDMAEAFTTQMFSDASHMALATKEPVETLRANLAAQGGVAERTLASLDVNDRIFHDLVFRFMEAMTAAAVKHGIPQDMAEASTKQVFFGASRMALAAGEPVEKLRANITTKGGITERKLASLDTNHQFFQDLIDQAYEAGMQTQVASLDVDSRCLLQCVNNAYGAGESRCRELGGTQMQATNSASSAGVTNFFKETGFAQEATAAASSGLVR